MKGGVKRGNYSVREMMHVGMRGKKDEWTGRERRAGVKDEEKKKAKES